MTAHVRMLGCCLYLRMLVADPCFRFSCSCLYTLSRHMETRLWCVSLSHHQCIDTCMQASAFSSSLSSSSVTPRLRDESEALVSSYSHSEAATPARDTKHTSRLTPALQAAGGSGQRDASGLYLSLSLSLSLSLMRWMPCNCWFGAKLQRSSSPLVVVRVLEAQGKHKCTLRKATVNALHFSCVSTCALAST